ncbi:hypothetical protein [Streptomyces formicae]|uniref:Glyoxalase-like domain-containing protein n=1 Tax=Streptomyces formicae TaxID=1616117 RepID=A0A291QAI2_9ACTN|nr:hypothetical protein [Streptomyces formicae]ATL28536.1 hypothetical protein KY5_3518 [Streptomyces formicae]
MDDGDVLLTPLDAPVVGDARLRVRARFEEAVLLAGPNGRGWVTLADPEGNEFCVECGAAERAAIIAAEQRAAEQGAAEQGAAEATDVADEADEAGANA